MSDSSQRTLEEIATATVDCASKLHNEARPGLLESVYEATLAKMLTDRDFSVQRQVPIPIKLMGLTFDEGFRADLIINKRFIIELKSVEKIAPVHLKQLLTYLRLTNNQLGLLINFGSNTFKEGVKRIVNNYDPA
jgi:iron complex transport system substrate-binding protein